MIGHRRIEHLTANLPQGFHRPGFVRAHHAGIAGNVGSKNCRQPALYAFLWHDIRLRCVE
jgi:hypothetical protein